MPIGEDQQTEEQQATEPEANRSGAPRILRFLRTGAAWTLAMLTGAGAVAASALALHLLYQRAASAERPEATPPLPVEVARAKIAPSYAEVKRFAGRIETTRETALAFERSGLLLEMAVEEGDRAEKGQIIAKLDARSLIAERDRLQAEKRRVEIQLALAERTRKRQQDLNTKGFASEQRFDEAQANETALKAQIDSISAQLRQREIDIEKSALPAPFDGIIAERFMDPGAVAPAGGAVARLLETGAPRARIGLPTEEAASLNVGESYPLSLRGKNIEGRLVALRPDLAPGTRTIAALFDLSGAVELSAADRSRSAGKLAAPAGEIVRLTMEREVSAQGMWLPLAAMQEGVKGLWSVYTVIRDDDASSAAGEPVWIVGQEAVEALHVRGQDAFVAGSLRDGTLVVVSGVNRIARGQRVRPLTPRAPSPDVGAAPGAGETRIARNAAARR